MEPSRCAPFLGTHYYLLWVHFSREPGVILTMVLASRRHRIREWYLMGAVERLLSCQVLGFQAPKIPELIAGRSDRHQCLSEAEDSSSDKCGSRDLNPGGCSDC